MSISLDQVTKRFGVTFGVEDVTTEIPSGALTAILGPSGAGKSTLLRLIGGLVTPDAGRISIDGEDVTDVDPRHRNIGFCFQNYAPFRHMTVAKNVAYGLKVRHRPRAEIAARVTEMLELVRLSDLAGRYPAQLSGGELQRMALARALAIEPRVLLLDEPFGALDAQVRGELRTWIKELHDAVHVTTVLVTHDQNEAMEIADNLLVLNEGRVAQVGTPTELYDHPASEFVLRFLGPSTTLDGQAVRPHDLEVVGPTEGTPAVVTEVATLGFEIRVSLRLDDGQELWAQMSRAQFQALAIGVGDRVGLRRRPGAAARPAQAAPDAATTTSTDGAPVTTPDDQGRALTR
ncbi:MAG TPA: TOBE-like domain-containing protein [Acidimicrobiales bacterium]|jgi:sulfate transport system ATP-binding protein|nr:TOBE-like domain-containing protein [Acidimicrobiales bacterium]